MKKVSNRLYLTQKIIDYIGVVFLGLLLLFIWQLYRGPIELPFLKPYMVRALNHDDAEYQVTVDSVSRLKLLPTMSFTAKTTAALS